MAPSFADLPDDDEYDSEEVDVSDLRANHEVSMEQGLDTFVVVDGLPKVTEEQKDKLIKFVLKKLNSAGKTSADNIFMPMGENGQSEGFAFVEYATPDQATAAIKQLNGTALDKRHTIAVNKLVDIERYGREGRVDDEYHPPDIPPFEEKEHLRWWLAEPNARDQFVMYRAESVGVFWNRKKELPENIVDRVGWTETFVAWSPLGTYLATTHARGVQLWAGESWSRHQRFPHPKPNMIDFSPNEKYLVTWSFKPIEVEEGDPILTEYEDGKNYIIWDVETGRPIRSFATLDAPGPSVDEQGNPVKRRIEWPAFKWSADDTYVARMHPDESVSVYTLPSMTLLDKTSIKIPGIRGFEWAPKTPSRDGVKAYEQLFSYWQPEAGSNPAKVGVMSIPSKEIIRTRNLFNVSDVKLHWQSESAYLCVKVDRHSKSKKQMSTNLEIFRVKEKGIPVEVVDSINATVINFAWEPKGNRFVLISTNEPVQQTAVPPKTSVSFYCPEKIKGPGVGNFKHIRTIEKKNNNAIYWSPKGRFVLIATIASQQSSDLDFWDLDYEGDKSKDGELTANLQQLATGDHYGVTDIEWDPTGRYVVSSASIFKQQIEHGYHIYDFKGELLLEQPMDKFKQFLWRPRPATMLTKDEQKQIRRNLREYSRDFEEQDRLEEDKERGAVVDERRRQLQDWLEFREEFVEDLRAERRELGLSEDPEEDRRAKYEGAEDAKVIEEIVEEIIDETEEIVTN